MNADAWRLHGKLVTNMMNNITATHRLSASVRLTLSSLCFFTLSHSVRFVRMGTKNSAEEKKNKIKLYSSLDYPVLIVCADLVWSVAGVATRHTTQTHMKLVLCAARTRHIQLLR